MANFLTERQAWLVLAKLWGGETKEFCGRVYVGNFNFGLCRSIDDLADIGFISDSLANQMKSKICRKIKSDIFPQTIEGAAQRVELCHEQVARIDAAKRRAKKRKAASR